jgi:peptidyl-prolyl cis-trans isomerase B (cyclophilin B)
MQALAPALVLFSVLFPSKLWYPPNQPLTIQVKSEAKVSLILTDFVGKLFDPRSPADFAGERTVDLRELYPQLDTPGTYLLYAVPTDKPVSDFIGTPLVISVRQDYRRDAPPGPIVTHVSPLSYAAITTDRGEMLVAFYYDVAPITVENFLSLAQGGFYDGLLFHRVVPDFIIQGGDPVGHDPARAGTGGPGYEIDAEFNDRQHLPGVISMAREDDPLERAGALPRPEAANTAGSQFFVALNYNRTRQLDRRYTAFGRVFSGMDVVRQIGGVPTEPQSQRPLEPPVIKQIRVLPVDAAHNPYPTLLVEPTTQPADAPSPREGRGQG